MAYRGYTILKHFDEYAVIDGICWYMCNSVAEARELIDNRLIGG